MNRKKHWENVYSERPARQTSWHQDEPRLSLLMIERAGIAGSDPIIDIGGGASLLVDHLLDRGFSDLSVLDVSAAALDQARKRLGERSGKVEWIEADVTAFRPGRRYRLWHDRAAFHFLTDPSDRERYVGVLHQALASGGQVIIATFSPSGPKRCSGLDIVQYDAGRMAAELGPAFGLQEQREEAHLTPAGQEQAFNFFRFQRRDAKAGQRISGYNSPTGKRSGKKKITDQK